MDSMHSLFPSLALLQTQLKDWSVSGSPCVLSGASGGRRAGGVEGCRDVRGVGRMVTRESEEEGERKEGTCVFSRAHN